MNGERLEMIRMLLKKIEYIRECISLPDVGGKAEPWHFKGVVSCHIARQADFSQSTIFCLFISSFSNVQKNILQWCVSKNLQLISNYAISNYAVSMTEDLEFVDSYNY